ncbi:Sigma-X negative effector [Fictibacillus macauensis ZFHKF-1]|uniref:Sigma-X negative effector n=1 Tax=Fictibacillus macauensis ZFHKF-1 TaxID=1196324 RepID=I8ANJ9_9BACL|nr:GerMN domain-containing protein [Fictibacillus macauensis]EIT87404.1 Sigma-X negative effector [Fictibacillus macauensis ZFHKF-1]
MASSKWTEDKIENELEKMPVIQDLRSKEVVYQEIEKRLQEKNVRRLKKTWIFPGVIAACAVGILLYITPDLLNESNGASEQKSPAVHEQKDHPKKTASTDHTKTHSQGNDGTKATAKKGTDGKNNQETPATREASRAKEREVATAAVLPPVTERKYSSPLTEEEMQKQRAAGRSLVTVAYTNDAEDVVIPISFLVKGDRPYADKVDQVLQTFQPEKVGLKPTILNKAIVKDDDGKAVLDFPKGAITSSESKLLPKLLGYTFAYDYKYSTVNFLTDGQPGVTTDEQGTLENMNVQDVKGGPAYVYTSSTGNQFLVDSFGAGKGTPPASFTNALQELSKEDESQALSSPIPEGTDLETTVASGIAKVNVEDYTLKNEEKKQQMIDAILVTAKNYHQSEVAIDYDEQEAGMKEVKKPYPAIVGVNVINK